MKAESCLAHSGYWHILALSYSVFIFYMTEKKSYIEHLFLPPVTDNPFSYWHTFLLGCVEVGKKTEDSATQMNLTWFGKKSKYFKNIRIQFARWSSKSRPPESHGGKLIIPYRNTFWSSWQNMLLDTQSKNFWMEHENCVFYKASSKCPICVTYSTGFLSRKSSMLSS